MYIQCMNDVLESIYQWLRSIRRYHGDVRLSNFLMERGPRVAQGGPFSEGPSKKLAPCGEMMVIKGAPLQGEGPPPGKGAPFQWPPYGMWVLKGASSREEAPPRGKGPLWREAPCGMRVLKGAPQGEGPPPRKWPLWEGAPYRIRVLKGASSRRGGPSMREGASLERRVS